MGREPRGCTFALAEVEGLWGLDVRDKGEARASPVVAVKSAESGAKPWGICRARRRNDHELRIVFTDPRGFAAQCGSRVLQSDRFCNLVLQSFAAPDFGRSGDAFIDKFVSGHYR